MLKEIEKFVKGIDGKSAVVGAIVGAVLVHVFRR